MNSKYILQNIYIYKAPSEFVNMVFKSGLLEKFKSIARPVKLMSGLALGGLASLISNDAKAQAFNYSLHATDVNGTPINNNSTIQAGSLINISFKLQTAQQSTIPAITDIFARPTLSFLGSASDFSIAGYNGTPGSTFTGTPTSNNVFSNDTSATPYTYDSNTQTFTINRSVYPSSVTLNNNSTYYFGTIQITASSGATGNGFTLRLPTYNSSNPNLNGSGSQFFILQNNTAVDLSQVELSGSNSFSFNVTAVPEPSTYALIAGGATLLAAAYMRRRRKSGSSSGVVNSRTETYSTDFSKKD